MGSTGRSRDRSRAGRQRETWALAVLAGLLLIAPELLGGVYAWGVLIIAGLACAALATAVWANQARTHVRGVLWSAFLLAFGWTVVQALPLPCWLVRLVAPESVVQLQSAYALLGRAAPTLCTISRDPGATTQEVVKGIAILAAFAAAALMVQLGQRRNVLRAVAAAGTLLAVVSLAHAVSEATKVFGVYAPVDVRDPPFLAPLLSLNTLGGLLVACWPAAAAMAVTTRSTRSRALWLCAVTVIAIVALMTRSRGAVGALVVALLAFGLLGLRARMQGARRVRALRDRIGIALAIAAAVGLAAYGSYTQMAHEFEAGAWDKLELIAAAWGFAREHLWLGVGRGAFSAVFAGFASNVGNRFEYPENFVLQWISEWGLPVSAVLLAALGWALLAALRRSLSWERSAAIAGCLALAAQNLVDLGSEYLAVAVIAVVLVACAVADRESVARPALEARLWRAPLGAFAIAGAAASTLLAPWLLRDEPSTLEAQLLSAQERNARDETRAILARAVSAHPSEPDFVLLAANDALQHRERNAGRWINRGLQLAPQWSAPHVQAALWLWNGGHRDQALLELATAARTDLEHSRALACEIAKAWPAGIVRVADKTGQAVNVLDYVARCPLSVAALDVIDEAILQRAPGADGARTRKAARALAAGRVDEALQGARDALRRNPEAVAAAGIEIQALLRLGRTVDALATVKRALAAWPQARDLRDTEARLLAGLRDRPALAAALSAMRANASDAPQLAHAYMIEAESESGFGNTNAAIRAYQQAYDIGAEPEPLRRVAVLARQLGDAQRARRAYAQLCAINPGDDESCTAAKTTLPHPRASAKTPTLVSTP